MCKEPARRRTGASSHRTYEVVITQSFSIFPNSVPDDHCDCCRCQSRSTVKLYVDGKLCGATSDTRCQVGRARQRVFRDWLRHMFHIDPNAYPDDFDRRLHVSGIDVKIENICNPTEYIVTAASWAHKRGRK